MRYLMKEKIMALGDDYVIHDETGREAFRVDGKVLTVRDALDLEDPAGNKLARIHKKLVALRTTYEIHREGAPEITISKALFSPLGAKFSVSSGGDALEARGNLLDHEYVFTRNGRQVAAISKQWFTVRDTYGVDVAEGEDPVLILACAVAIDRMCHDENDVR